MSHTPSAGAHPNAIVQLRPALVRVASAMLRRSPTHPDVEDLAQEACARILEALDGRYDPRLPLEPYAKGLVRKVARTQARNEATRGALREAVKPALAEQERLHPDLPSRGVDAREARAAVIDLHARVLGELTRAQAVALRAVNGHGWSIRRTARLMGRSEAAVNSLLGHGRDRARTRCDEAWRALAAG